MLLRLCEITLVGNLGVQLLRPLGLSFVVNVFLWMQMKFVFGESDFILSSAFIIVKHINKLIACFCGAAPCFFIFLDESNIQTLSD